MSEAQGVKGEEVVVAADIGGTTSRWIAVNENEEIVAAYIIRTADRAPQESARSLLELLQKDGHTVVDVRMLVAGHAVGDQGARKIKLTNSEAVCDEAALGQIFGVPVRIENDMAATAAAMEEVVAQGHLPEAERGKRQEQLTTLDAMIKDGGSYEFVFITNGTGLGTGAAKICEGKTAFDPSEVQHTPAIYLGARQQELFAYIRPLILEANHQAKKERNYVSGEDVGCMGGLPYFYEALRLEEHANCSRGLSDMWACLREVFRGQTEKPSLLSPEEVVDLARGENQRALDAITAWSEAVGQQTAPIFLAHANAEALMITGGPDKLRVAEGKPETFFDFEAFRKGLVAASGDQASLAKKVLIFYPNPAGEPVNMIGLRAMAAASFRKQKTSSLGNRWIEVVIEAFQNVRGRLPNLLGSYNDSFAKPDPR